MFVVILLAAAAILAAVVAVAMGRGGELSRSQPERPRRADFRTGADVASYRPPPALLGYQAAATEQALALIARTLAERDAEIEWLRQRLAQERLAQERLARDPGGEVGVADLMPAGDSEPDATAGRARADGASG